MKTKLLLFLFCLSAFNSLAQDYGVDTTFRFQPAKIQLDEYQYREILAQNDSVIIAYIVKNTNHEDPSAWNFAENRLAIIDTTGAILDSFHGYSYIPNSLSDAGFGLMSSSSDYEATTFVYYYYDFSLKQLIKKTPPKLFSGEGAYFLRDSFIAFNFYDEDIAIYDLNDQLISRINFNHLKGHDGKFALVDIRLDEDQTAWVLVDKIVGNTNDILQLYKVKKNELLDNSKLVFEKKSQDVMPSPYFGFWGNMGFWNDKIAVILTKDFEKPRELILFDSAGKKESLSVMLPLINNDINTHYEILKNKSNPYCILRAASSLHFIDTQGNKQTYTFPTSDYYNINLGTQSVFLNVTLPDNQVKVSEVSLSSGQQTAANWQPPQKPQFLPLTHIQTLSNGDYWIGYQNPYQNPFDKSKYFVKYRNEKEIFRLTEPAEGYLYLGENDVLFQNKTSVFKINAANEITYLDGIQEKIAFADTLHKQIYTALSDRGKRYSYDGVWDETFVGNTKLSVNYMAVDSAGNIYSNNAKFSLTGQEDTNFQGGKYTPYQPSAPYFRSVKIIGNKVYFMAIVCGEGCYGGINEIDLQSGKEIRYYDFYKDFYSNWGNNYDIVGDFVNMVARDSLVLFGLRKLLPNAIQVDTTFKVHGKLGFGQGSLSLFKQLDILPNYDLLGIFKNQLYRFSKEHALWAEIRNLSSQIALNDSLRTHGLPLEVFSSDGSEVNVKIVDQFTNTSIGKVVRLENNTLYFYGNYGTVSIEAQSVNGGIPYTQWLQVSTPNLKTSTIHIAPSDTTVYFDFQPFTLNYSVDADVPVEVTIDDPEGFLKDNVVTPNGKTGVISILIRHDGTNTYQGNAQSAHIRIQKYPQEIMYNNVGAADETAYYLRPTDFPFKVPVTCSSGRWSELKTDGFRSPFYIQNDSVFLKENYLNYIDQNQYYGQSTYQQFFGAIAQESEKYAAKPFNFSIQFYFRYSDNVGRETAENFLMAYPNPCDEELSLIFSSNETIKELNVYQINGAFVATLLPIRSWYDVITTSLNDSLLGNKNEYSVKDLPPGIYLISVKLRSPSGYRNVVKRIIKK